MAKYPGMDFTLLIDANARTGSVPSAGIGPAAVQTENRNGPLLRAYLDRFALAAINTFYKGATATWRSTRGYWCCIDYIVAPLHLAPRVEWCRTMDDIALTFSTEIDHVAVGARMAFSSIWSWCPSKAIFRLQQGSDAM